MAGKKGKEKRGSENRPERGRRGSGRMGRESKGSADREGRGRRGLMG
jgi:hypothetical protein